MPNGPWHLTLVDPVTRKFTFSHRHLVLGTPDLTGVQNTRLPSIFLGAQPWTCTTNPEKGHFWVAEVLTLIVGYCKYNLTFLVKMSFICVRIKKIIFISVASHLASLWENALGKLRNGLLSSLHVSAKFAFFQRPICHYVSNMPVMTRWVAAYILV